MLIENRYLLLERLGGGGMGEVYLAQDKRLQRPVALKRLLPHLVGREDLVARSEREGQILARLDHAAINRVHDMLDSPDGGKFLILEYVDGRSFAAELRDEGRLPWNRCADVGIQVCGALAAAHAAGVVHRDIKPANILVRAADGSVHVADFGIARLSSAPASIVDGTFIGTPDYWAPEQANGGEVTASSDIYSLCCVLFEAACGRPPYVVDRDAGVAAGFLVHLTAAVPDPHDLVPDLPPAARDLLMRGLAKAPAERFASATELQDALSASRTPSTAPAPVATASLVESETLEPPPPPAPASVAVPPNAAEGAPGPTPALAQAPAAVPTPPPATQSPLTEAHAGGGPQETASRATPDTRVGTARNARTAASPSSGNAETVFTPEDLPAAAERRGVPRLAVVAACAVVVAVLAGAFVGVTVAPTRAASVPDPVVVGTKAVQAGHIRAAVPSDWSRDDAAATSVAPFDMRDAVEVRPPGAGRPQAIVVGTSSATGPALLPDAISQRRRSVVGMGQLIGYRYERIRAGGRPVTAFVAPATVGVPTVLCPAAAGPGASACAALVASMKLAGASPFPLGPGPEQTKTLRQVFGKIDSSLAVATAIGRAPAASGQASAARTVAAGLRTALRAIPGPGDASPAILPALADLRAAVSAQATAYEALASAAGSIDSGAWSSARSDIAAAGRRLTTALSELRRAGYAAH